MSDANMFLPTTREEMEARGWKECDVILVSGDAYVDHPHFGVAVIGRVLEAAGYRVGIIAQPDWRSTKDFMELGRPRLFFGVTSGNMESNLARLTVNRKLRSRDAYSPGGQTDLRPNRAAVVYSNRLREAFGDVVIILGGLECSLRRLAHYDFWTDSVRRSILIDAKADMIVYGMAEHSLLEVTRRLEQGQKPRQITDVAGTVVCVGPGHDPEGAIIMPSFRDVIGDKKNFNAAFKIFYENNDPFTGKPIAQKTNTQYILHNPPAKPLTTEELDAIYDLPYTRRWHPKYDAAGGVPALETVRFSISTHRGCFGNCNFCSLSAHQGTIVQSRSVASVVKEATLLTQHPEFAGTIVDVGGPTANMYGMGCKHGKGTCKDRSCLVPEICKNLNADLSRHLEVLRAVREVPGVRRVFVASGIRHDLCLVPGGEEYLRELCQYHIGGRLKIAPEHISGPVLQAMNKPAPETYEAFSKLFSEIQSGVDREQYVVQYFMAGHPGCRHEDMLKLAEYLRERRLHPEQAQDYYPAPLTVSACMFYTGYHPLTDEKIFTVKRERERLMQRAMIHFWEPKNHKLVREALKLMKRKDLIGHARKCIVPPDEEAQGGGDRGGFRGKRPFRRAGDRPQEFVRHDAPPPAPMPEAAMDDDSDFGGTEFADAPVTYGTNYPERREQGGYGRPRGSYGARSGGHGRDGGRESRSYGGTRDGAREGGRGDAQPPYGHDGGRESRPYGSRRDSGREGGRGDAQPPYGRDGGRESRPYGGRRDSGREGGRGDAQPPYGRDGGREGRPYGGGREGSRSESRSPGGYGRDSGRESRPYGGGRDGGRGDSRSSGYGRQGGHEGLPYGGNRDNGNRDPGRNEPRPSGYGRDSARDSRPPRDAGRDSRSGPPRSRGYPRGNR